MATKPLTLKALLQEIESLHAKTEGMREVDDAIGKRIDALADSVNYLKSYRRFTGQQLSALFAIRYRGFWGRLRWLFTGN